MTEASRKILLRNHAGVLEQQQLQERNHTPQQDKHAADECQALVVDGYEMQVIE